VILICHRRQFTFQPVSVHVTTEIFAVHQQTRRFLVNRRQLFQNPGDSGVWFDSDAIIDRRPSLLLAAKVSLGRLNRDMSQQELDLLQFAS
jgi:hypothetical protein